MSHAAEKAGWTNWWELWASGKRLGRIVVSLRPKSDGVLVLDVLRGRVKAVYWQSSNLDGTGEVPGEAEGPPGEEVLLRDLGDHGRSADSTGVGVQHGGG